MKNQNLLLAEGKRQTKNILKSPGETEHIGKGKPQISFWKKFLGKMLKTQAHLKHLKLTPNYYYKKNFHPKKIF